MARKRKTEELEAASSGQDETSKTTESPKKKRGRPRKKQPEQGPPPGDPPEFVNALAEAIAADNQKDSDEVASTPKAKRTTSKKPAKKAAPKKNATTEEGSPEDSTPVKKATPRRAAPRKVTPKAAPKKAGGCQKKGNGTDQQPSPESPTQPGSQRDDSHSNKDVDIKGQVAEQPLEYSSQVCESDQRPKQAVVNHANNIKASANPTGISNNLQASGVAPNPSLVPGQSTADKRVNIAEPINPVQLTEQVKTIMQGAEKSIAQGTMNVGSKYAPEALIRDYSTLLRGNHDAMHRATGRDIPRSQDHEAAAAMATATPQRQAEYLNTRFIRANIPELADFATELGLQEHELAQISGISRNPVQAGPLQLGSYTGAENPQAAGRPAALYVNRTPVHGIPSDLANSAAMKSHWAQMQQQNQYFNGNHAQMSLSQSTGNHTSNSFQQETPGFNQNSAHYASVEWPNYATGNIQMQTPLHPQAPGFHGDLIQGGSSEMASLAMAAQAQRQLGLQSSYSNARGAVLSRSNFVAPFVSGTPDSLIPRAFREGRGPMASSRQAAPSMNVKAPRSAMKFSFPKDDMSMVIRMGDIEGMRSVRGSSSGLCALDSNSMAGFGPAGETGGQHSSGAQMPETLQEYILSKGPRSTGSATTPQDVSGAELVETPAVSATSPYIGLPSATQATANLQKPEGGTPLNLLSDSQAQAGQGQASYSESFFAVTEGRAENAINDNRLQAETTGSAVGVQVCAAPANPSSEHCGAVNQPDEDNGRRDGVGKDSSSHNKQVAPSSTELHSRLPEIPAQSEDPHRQEAASGGETAHLPQQAGQSSEQHQADTHDSQLDVVEPKLQDPSAMAPKKPSSVGGSPGEPASNKVRKHMPLEEEYVLSPDGQLLQQASIRKKKVDMHIDLPGFNAANLTLPEHKSKPKGQTQVSHDSSNHCAQHQASEGQQQYANAVDSNESTSQLEGSNAVQSPDIDTDQSQNATASQSQSAPTTQPQDSAAPVQNRNQAPSVVPANPTPVRPSSPPTDFPA